MQHHHAKCVSACVGLIAGLATFTALFTLFFPSLQWLTVGIALHVALVMAIFVTVLAYWAGDFVGLIGTVPTREAGVVTAKHFTASSTSSGLRCADGAGSASSIGMGGEGFAIEICLERDGRMIRMEVTREIFFALDAGDPVSVSARISRFSGKTHWSRLVVERRSFSC